MEKMFNGYLYIPCCEDRSDVLELLPYARNTLLLDFRALPRHYRRLLLEQTETINDIPNDTHVLLEYVPTLPFEALSWIDILDVYGNEALETLGTEHPPSEDDILRYLRSKGTTFSHYLDYLTWRNPNVDWEEYVSVTIDIPPLKEGELEILLSEESDEFHDLTVGQ